MTRQLALPWVATVAVVALLVGGGLGTVVGYVVHGDGDSSSSFQRGGPGGFPGGQLPGGQQPGGQQPGGQQPGGQQSPMP